MGNAVRFRLLLILLLGFSLPPVARAQGADVITQRFGEQATCDVTGVTMDARVSSQDKNLIDGAAETHYYRWQNHILMRFDLSSIPQGARVRRAVLRFAYHQNFHDGGKTGVVLPIRKVTDPNGTGLWNESSVSYSAKRPGVAWSAGGDLGSVLGETIGEVYYREWFAGGQDYLEAELTAAAQDWVNNPAGNLGLFMPCHENFNKRIAAKEYPNAALRPYLEVTWEGPNTEAIPQPTQLQARHYSGQTFITWKEAQTGKDETSYRIYRHSQPITAANLDQAELVDQVYQGSSWLTDSIFNPATFKQPDLTPAGVTLAADSGLYVLPVEQSGSSYYAVTTVVEGNENRTLAGGVNATANPVAEQPGHPAAFRFNAEYWYVGYVMWLGRYNPNDPSDAFGL
ncbi:MAG TPA: DNRLRE domain-containing protein, partial [Candidatus Sumerlaeota bacterium]|nr:DNRLRE domain-containing protein [Candidatus Sumerlaeota bacterium]